MMPRAVFLDLDGVLVDPAKLGPEYVRLLGHVIAPVLGGTPEDWGRANAETFPGLLDRLTNEIDPDTSPEEAYRLEYVENIRSMCARLGRPAPGEAECERLGRRMNIYVRGYSRAVFPEAPEAVMTLAGRYELHLATGNPSWLGEAQLRQMGVLDRIGLLCGPDLVGVLKRSSAFYVRLFDQAGVSAREAVVVDDSREQLARAAALGARTILVAPGPADGGGVDAVVSSIEHVAGAVERFSQT